VDDAPLVGPEPMQGEDEFLEGHEQSSRRLSNYEREKMETEANRNRWKLSRNCTQIKELQTIDTAGS
jgi:hypothetical protein